MAQTRMGHGRHGGTSGFVHNGGGLGRGRGGGPDSWARQTSPLLDDGVLDQVQPRRRQPREAAQPEPGAATRSSFKSTSLKSCGGTTRSPRTARSGGGSRRHVILESYHVIATRQGLVRGRLEALEARESEC